LSNRRGRGCGGRRLGRRDPLRQPSPETFRIFRELAVDVRAVARSLRPLDDSGSLGPFLEQLQRVRARLVLLPGVVEDYDLETGELPGVDRLEQPRPGLRNRRVTRLPRAQGILLAAAQKDGRAGHEVPEGFEPERYDFRRVVRLLAVSLGGQILGVGSPPLPALSLLVPALALVVDAEEAAAPGDAGIGEGAAGGVVANPCCPDRLGGDTPLLEVGELVPV
jgi:hypothetical protein